VKLARTWKLGVLLLVVLAAAQALGQDRIEPFWIRPSAPEFSLVGGTWRQDRMLLLPEIERLPGDPRDLHSDRAKLPPLPARQYRLPGEFERQAALLIGCTELVREMPSVFAEIIEATRGSVDILALVNNHDELDEAKRILSRRRFVGDVIHFVEVPHNTMWARDYGPVVVEVNGKPSLVDALYDDATRPDDDRVPSALAARLALPVIQAPLHIEGGNLLSNGRGLCIATEMLAIANAGRLNEPGLRRWLKQLYGAKQTVFLEPLLGEGTSHVDMFATFTSPDTVVVGAYDPAEDPENAEILDRNAERLSEVIVNGRNLRVVRIPMPAHDDGIWRTYTNVVFANGVLLVPIYLGVDEKGRQTALDTFARLLPGWRIVGIDSGELIESAGALHCITMNLGPLGRLPDLPKPTRGGRLNLAAPIPAFDVAPARVSSFGEQGSN